MTITRATDLANIGSGIGTIPAQPLQLGVGVTIGGAVGVVTATTFIGNLSGNVTGNVSGSSGSCSGNSATATVATNAQGLTGTPDIAVRNITGVAATFTGVLTYEDVTNIDAIGIITARSDVSIADKIIHTGDTNTAIRFPAADTFTVETGGSEALRIDSSQRLLLGDTSARTVGTIDGLLAKIAIETPNNIGAGLNIVWNRSQDTYGPRIRLGKSRTATVGGSTVVENDDELGTIEFCGADGTDLTNLGAKIECKVDGTPGGNDMPGRLVFYTSADGSGAPTERLRITSAGLVRVPDNGKFTAGAGDDLQIYHDGSNSYITNSTGMMRIQGTQLQVKDEDGNESLANFIPQGAVELYYDNSKKLETKSDGVVITGELECDSLDVQGNLDIHATRISYDTSNEHLKFLDNIELVFGNGDDLKIYHDGSDNVIILHGNETRIVNSAVTETFAKFVNNGAVELYHNNCQET